MVIFRTELSSAVTFQAPLVVCSRMPNVVGGECAASLNRCLMRHSCEAEAANALADKIARRPVTCEDLGRDRYKRMAAWGDQPREATAQLKSAPQAPKGQGEAARRAVLASTYMVVPRDRGGNSRACAATLAVAVVDPGWMPGSVAKALRSSPLSSGSSGYRAVPRLASS